MSFLDKSVGYKSYTMHKTIDEAKRCLRCKIPSCRKECPINNDIPDFIYQLSEGNLGETREMLARETNLPVACGHICPHEKQCVGHCVLNAKHAPMQVGKLEEFIADFDAEMGLVRKNLVHKTRGKVAAADPGPAGFTAADDLVRQGFNVVIYEKKDEPGGVLVYKIPESRLPKEVVRKEIKKIGALGVTFLTSAMIGPDLTVDDMFSRDHDAIFISAGTALARDIDLPGRDKAETLQAIYFLRIVALYNSGDVDKGGIPLKQGDKVVITGAGNVAVGAAHTALRVGAGSVVIVYHRGKEDISALKLEYHSALEEGVRFIWHAKPTQFSGNEEVSSITLKQGDQFLDVDADVITLMIGSKSASRTVFTTTGIEVNPNGCVVIEERPYGMTMRKGVLAGGDVIHQPATVALTVKEAERVAGGATSYADTIELLGL